MIKQTILGYFTLLLLWGQASFATESSSPGPLFETTVNDLTLSITTTIPHRCYQFAGIKSLSPLVTLSNAGGGGQCTPTQKGYCLFQVCDNSPANFTYSGPAGSADFNLCLNGKGDTSSCQKLHLSTQYAYVADDFAHVWQCPVNPNGSFGTCKILLPAENQPDFVLWGGPFKIAFTHVGGAEYSYIADGDFSGDVYTCSLNDTNDTYNSCVISSTFTDASQVAFAISSGTQYAYVADYGPFPPASPFGTVLQCKISSINGSLNSCQKQTNVSWITPAGVTTEKFKDSKYVYVSDPAGPNNGKGTVHQCAINSITGSFSSCAATPTPSPTWFPWEVAFQRVNGVQYAYVADSGNPAGGVTPGHIWQCTLNSNGSFNMCNQLHPSFTTTAYQEPFGIAFAKVDGVQYAYVSDSGTAIGTFQVYQCTLNRNGTFNECSVLQAPSGGWKPNGVTFLSREKETSHR